MLVRSEFWFRFLQAIPPALQMVSCGDADAMSVFRLEIERFLQSLGRQEMMSLSGSEVVCDWRCVVVSRRM